MAFISENNTTISFAEYTDVASRDQRIFDGNEGLTDDVVETALIRSTTKILDKIRATDWWRDYYTRRDSSLSYTTRADVPQVDPDKIKSRQADFTELCVYWALAEYILPQVADFGDEADSDRAKMGWYANKHESLFAELIHAGDWYDFDDDDTVQSDEKQPGVYTLRRRR